ncbi:MAG: ASKHA domain-containing protein [Oscillospiraceae bacterium]|jgi:uncharacterized 2Fe-2S/4Fe-4S cluster protein (DUF4445 family)|nr:ASKHA domain-containing protein [Oscillospiraceae bacterium]
MSYTITVHQSGAVLGEFASAGGEDIRTFLAANGVFLDSPCGGRGKCGKCTVKLSPDGADVRACQTNIESDLDLYIPGEMKMEIVIDARSDESSRRSSFGKTPSADSFAEMPAAGIRGENGGGNSYGVAVDIGTTTVVAHLHDLASGVRLATASGVNAQRVHGADVVSRIEFSAENGHAELTRLIQTQLCALVSEACGKAGVPTARVTYMVIAGNTIMQHLAAGYSPVGMGAVPFEPVSLFGAELPPFEGLNLAPDAKIFYAPCVASYVGGDITAGLLCCDLESDAGPTVFIDIGTNGEMALKRGGKYVVCATAAGPAFEGAEIERGMAAIPGAVSKVEYSDGALKLRVIGDVPPAGLCGSGLLDALAVMLDSGVVDDSGRMQDADEISHPLAAQVGLRDGKNVFYLDRGRDVFVSSGDVRKLQLAKAAIAGGLHTMMRAVGVAPGDVLRFVLAGGFGSYLDKNSAAKIGLFPREFLAVCEGRGNTAGEGAAVALLSAERRRGLNLIDDKCEYIELSTSPVFNEEFVDNMTFDAPAPGGAGLPG